MNTCPISNFSLSILIFIHFFRCTDGILFVVDSVDTERMEEAKMELMRTAKCPDNQGVPVLILANKQDLPNACCPKELEKLLGLHELQSSITSNISTCSLTSSTGNIVAHSSTADHSSTDHSICSVKQLNSTHQQLIPDLSKGQNEGNNVELSRRSRLPQNVNEESRSKAPSLPVSTSPATMNSSQFAITHKKLNPSTSMHLKGWYIQPACAITGEGLQEGLDALYDMILKRRKINKSHKKNKR